MKIIGFYHKCQMQPLLVCLLLYLVPIISGQVPKRDKQDTGGGSGKRVVCYYSNWSVYRPNTAKFSPQNINPYLCTHLIYAFGGIDKEHGLKPFDKYQDIEQGGYTKFTGLKAYNKALVTLLAIGGWNEGSTRFSPLVADPERRAKFVKNAVSFLRQHNFDGLDLDWEYPTFRDGGKPHDRENYAKLVQELREEFDAEAAKSGRKRLLLTMAVPAGIKYLDKGYDIPKLNKYLDFMNLLTYDYHSAFEPTIRHHSPLYNQDTADYYNNDNQLNIDSTVRYFLLKGASESKLVVGIPTYGRSYTISDQSRTELGSPADGPGEQGSATREKGFLAYHEICSSVQNDNWTVVHEKESAMGPYAYKANQWVGYDDPAIVKAKAQYVKKRNLGGIMFWSIDNDDFRGVCHNRPYPLIEAGKEALLGTTSSSKSNSKSSKPSLIKSALDRRNNKAKTVFTTAKTTTTVAPSNSATTTPVPPTTPDPGSDFVCKDEGFFPHPRDCKKYFWCLDSGPSNLGIVAHQFTCPSGLYFNKAADSCDFSRNVLCRKKSSTTTTTTYKPEVETKKSVVTSKATLLSRTTYTTTTTTTTTAAPIPEEEEEEEEDFNREDQSEEDPETIRQLIALIKKLGGVAELEKQLEGNNAQDSHTKGISRNLVNKFLSNKPQQNHYRNEALIHHDKDPELIHKEKKRPQYVSIRNNKHRNLKTELQEEVTDDEELEQEIHVETPKPTRPQYVNFRNNRQRPSLRNESLDSIEESELHKETKPKHTRPQYVTLRSNNRYRNIKTESPELVEEEFEEVEIQNTHKPTRPPYVTLRSNSRYTTLGSENQSDLGTRSSFQSRSRARKPQYTNIRNQKPRERSKETEDESKEVEDEGVEADEVNITYSTSKPQVTETTSKRSRPTYQRVNRFRSSTNDQEDVSSTTSGFSTESVRSTLPVRTTFSRFSSRNEPAVIEVHEIPIEDLEEETKEIIKPSRPLYNVTPRTNNYVTPQRRRPQLAVSVEPQSEPQPPPQIEQVKVEQISDSDEYYTQGISTEGYIVETTSPITTSTLPPTTVSNRIRRPTARAPFIRKITSTTVSPPVSVSRRVQSRTRGDILRQRTKDQERPHTQLLDDGIIKYTTLATPKRFSPTISPLTSGKSTVRSESPRSSFRNYDDYEEEYFTDPIDIPLSGKVRIHTDGYIECLDVGNFPHPFSCRKFISCAKMENLHLLGWEYTCPKGLSFDPIGSICNWNAGLGCKE